MQGSRRDEQIAFVAYAVGQAEAGLGQGKVRHHGCLPPGCVASGGNEESVGQAAAAASRRRRLRSRPVKLNS
jgi:hypothetical protein